MAHNSMPDTGPEIPVLRRLILALLVFGMVSVVVDLYLIDHHEDSAQFVPFVVVALGLVTLAWHVATRNAASVRFIQAAMALFILAGCVGMVLHYRGNMEFQLDIDPSLGGWALFDKVVRAKAPPTLAPGTLIQLGLLGLIYAYRHPALAVGMPSPFSSGA